MVHTTCMLFDNIDIKLVVRVVTNKKFLFQHLDEENFRSNIKFFPHLPTLNQ